MAQPNHSVSVAGVVQRTDGRVLVIRRADNAHWEIPGGILEPGEGIETGLMREILEETGVMIGESQLTGVYKNMPNAIVALVFKCKPTSLATHLTDETTAVEWLQPDDAVVRMHESFAIRVTDAITSSTPMIREHDGTRLTPKK